MAGPHNMRPSHNNEGYKHRILNIDHAEKETLLQDGAGFSFQFQYFGQISGIVWGSAELPSDVVMCLGKPLVFDDLC